MLSLHAALVLGLCIFFPSLTLADDPPPQSAELYWRWKDEGNSDPKDQSIFTGHAIITWVRKESCQTTGAREDYIPVLSGTSVAVKASTKNKSKDYLDPKSVVHSRYGMRTDLGKCDHHTGTSFWIHNGDRTQKMLIKLPDICTDGSCKGPDKERPNVQCLKGPKGRIVMYRDKWIDECFDP